MSSKHANKKVEQNSLVFLDVNEIEFIEGRNVRFEYGDLNALADMICADGLRNPIKIQYVDGKPQLTEGHRRYRAGQLIKERFSGDKIPEKHGRPVTTFPCYVIENDAKYDSILIDQILSNEGKAFVPLEEGEAYRRLRDDFKMTLETIAERVGKSVSHVSRRLALFNAAPELKNHVQEGTLKASTATDIAIKTGGNHREQQKVAEYVSKKKEEGKTGPEIDKQIADNIQKSKEKQQEKPKKVGRLVQWQRQIADDFAQNFFAAISHPDCQYSKTDDWKNGDIIALLTKLEGNADADFLMAMGAMVALATLDGTELYDFLNKMHKEQTGKVGNFKPTPVKEEVVEEAI